MNWWSRSHATGFRVLPCSCRISAPRPSWFTSDDSLIGNFGLKYCNTRSLVIISFSSTQDFSRLWPPTVTDSLPLITVAEVPILWQISYPFCQINDHAKKHLYIHFTLRSGYNLVSCCTFYQINRHYWQVIINPSISHCNLFLTININSLYLCLARWLEMIEPFGSFTMSRTLPKIISLSTSPTVEYFIFTFRAIISRCWCVYFLFVVYWLHQRLPLMETLVPSIEVVQQLSHILEKSLDYIKI